MNWPMVTISKRINAIGSSGKGVVVALMINDRSIEVIGERLDSVGYVLGD